MNTTNSVTADETLKCFVWRGSFENRQLPERAGFAWSEDRQRWETYRVDVARKVGGEFDAQAAEIVGSILRSRATDSTVVLPVPSGLSYLPFQRAGIAYALEHKNTLIADEMGLGKTVQAAGVINADHDIHSVLVLCPASVKLNWKRELERWLTVKMPIRVVTSNDKKLPRPGGVTIINYDILHRFVFSGYDLLIADECHYLKNATARRSKRAYSIRAERKLFLTGTPILSRPIELYPILKALDPKNWPSKEAYGVRYCAGFMDDWGWNFQGAGHLDELQDRLRASVMIRRLKSEVLTELPRKVRQVIELPATGKVLKAERDGRRIAETICYETDVAKLKIARQEAFETLAELRHATALSKVAQVVEYVKDALEDSRKIVLFAHHRDVISELTDALGAFNPRVITGDTTMAVRQANVDLFQNDPTCRLFIGNIQAAGLGITLTAASHVIFAELDFVPGVMCQAEDRCHRIGQKDSVLVQHLVLEGSIDAVIAKTLVRKQDILDSALDKRNQQPTGGK